MPFIDAFEGSKRAAVMQDTWGHMKPSSTSKVRGNISVYYTCHSVFGILRDDVDVPNGGGPWWYDHLSAFPHRVIDRMKEGTVRRFFVEVSYRKKSERYFIKILGQKTIVV